MRKLPAVLFGLCLTLCPLAATAADHSGDPHWIKDSQSGCWIYNAQPQSGEDIVWEGARCSDDGEASGLGTVTWFQYGAWVLVEKGEMRGGAMQGAWIRRSKDGQTETSYWVDGVRQEDAYADQGGDAGGDAGDGGSTYSPIYNGDAYMETLKRQNRENCERAAKGANIACHPE